VGRGEVGRQHGCWAHPCARERWLCRVLGDRERGLRARCDDLDRAPRCAGPCRWTKTPAPRAAWTFSAGWTARCSATGRRHPLGGSMSVLGRGTGVQHWPCAGCRQPEPAPTTCTWSRPQGHGPAGRVTQPRALATCDADGRQPRSPVAPRWARATHVAHGAAAAFGAEGHGRHGVRA
jgi:hypothetical protein